MCAAAAPNRPCILQASAPFQFLHSQIDAAIGFARAGHGHHAERHCAGLHLGRDRGHAADGRPWRIGIRDGRHSGSIERTIELEDTALAVSGGYGTTFEPSGRYHHIFDPRTGASANRLVDVTVIGPRATAADGLATAICVAGETLAPALLAAFPRTRAILTRADGTSMAVTANRT